MPAAAASRSASTSGAVTTSPGAIAGIPGGYGATVSAAILPGASATGTASRGAKKASRGPSATSGCTAQTALAAPGFRGSPRRRSRERSERAGQPLDALFRVADGQKRHEQVAVGELEPDTFREEIVLDLEAVRAGPREGEGDLGRIVGSDDGQPAHRLQLPPQAGRQLERTREKLLAPGRLHPARPVEAGQDRRGRARGVQRLEGLVEAAEVEAPDRARRYAPWVKAASVLCADVTSASAPRASVCGGRPGWKPRCAPQAWSTTSGTPAARQASAIAATSESTPTNDGSTRKTARASGSAASASATRSGRDAEREPGLLVDVRPHPHGHEPGEDEAGEDRLVHVPRDDDAVPRPPEG